MPPVFQKYRSLSCPFAIDTGQFVKALMPGVISVTFEPRGGQMERWDPTYLAEARSGHPGS